MPFLTVFSKPVVARYSVATLIVCTASLLFSAPAQADLKMTSKVTSTGGPSPTATGGVVYYKGKKMRSESEKSVILFDGEKGTITTINVPSKTYTVVTMASLANNNPALQMVDMKTTVDMQPGGKTKSLLGKQVKNYNFTATIKMSLKKEMLDRINASAKAQGGAAPPMPTMPTITIKGENWVAEKVNLPAGAIAASMGPLSMIPGMKALVDKFTSVKGVPLESNIIIAIVGGPQGARNQTITTLATTLSEAPLSDSLFTVPADYTKSASGMPGMAGPAPTGARTGP